MLEIPEKCLPLQPNYFTALHRKAQKQERQQIVFSKI
jgi:hypothetical protein